LAPLRSREANPNSVFQAARQRALLGLTTLAVTVGGPSGADNIRTGALSSHTEPDSGFKHKEPLDR